MRGGGRAAAARAGCDHRASIKTVAQANAAPFDHARLCRDRRRVRDARRRTTPMRRSAWPACATSSPHSAPARAICRSAALPESTRGNARRVIAAGADGVAVISALSMHPIPQAAARELRGVVDAALAQEAGMTADRGHHRRIGFQRRRRHPGRPQDLFRARRLWRLGDHRAHRAEHPRRDRRSTTCRRDFIAAQIDAVSPISMSTR